MIAGKYRVERLLGHGGMGVVVSARHLQLDQQVAIKFLLPEVLRQREPVERFLREARAAVKIQSEHVAKVLDVGQLETGAPYMVMEYLDGRDLSDVLENDGPLPVEDALTYLLETCEAIAEAHRLGIIHRDIKPSNLFLAKSGGRGAVVKVLDFGISKIEHDAGGKLTTTNIAMGSPHYMSPEHIKNPKMCDARSDIWSLGMVLYELLGGRTAFTAETLPALFVAVATEKPKPINELRPDIPPELAETIMRCLSKEPEQRFQSVSELAEALAPMAPVKSRAYAERVGLTASRPSAKLTLGQGVAPDQGTLLAIPPAVPSATPIDGHTDATPGSTDKIEVPMNHPSRKPLFAAGAAAVVLALVGLGVGRGTAGAGTEPIASSQPIAAAASQDRPRAQPEPERTTTQRPEPTQAPPAASEAARIEVTPVASVSAEPGRKKDVQSGTQTSQPTPPTKPGPGKGVRGMLDDRR